MNAVQVSLNPPSQEDAGHRSPEQALSEQALSALADGELSEDQLVALWATDAETGGVLSTWHSYHVIGEVLRGEVTATPFAHAPSDFLAGVRERLRSEAAPVLQTPPKTLTVRGVAANDAVFRWQLVAGLASLAAVMAISWTVLNGASAEPGASAPQLAAGPAPAATVAAHSASPAQPSTTVVVNTGQGPLIRDARLEELLAEHRQNGGMSALQMPTGFIRGATYDAAGR